MVTCVEHRSDRSVSEQTTALTTRCLKKPQSSGCGLLPHRLRRNQDPHGRRSSGREEGRGHLFPVKSAPHVDSTRSNLANLLALCWICRLALPTSRSLVPQPGRTAPGHEERSGPRRHGPRERRGWDRASQWWQSDGRPVTLRSSSKKPQHGAPTPRSAVPARASIAQRDIQQAHLLLKLGGRGGLKAESACIVG